MPTPLKTNEHEKAPHTAHGEVQRRALVRAAYELIAEKGFEGLRTRDVADKANVNVATLHYYFASKEDLIRGVVEYLREEFRFQHAPPPAPTDSKPLEYLRQELADASYHIQRFSDHYVVFLEICLRSLRDDSIKYALGTLDDQWLGAFERHIAEGIEQGVFRPDLDVPATAAALIAFIKGAMFQLLFSPPEMFPAERVYAQVEQWLTHFVLAEAPR